MSLVFSSDDVSEKALHGIDEQPKERRRSRLREQRDELLEHLKMHVLARRDVGDVSRGLLASEALIERVEKGA